MENCPEGKTTANIRNNVLVKITTSNICGSDLYMYEGRSDFKPGGGARRFR